VTGRFELATLTAPGTLDRPVSVPVAVNVAGMRPRVFGNTVLFGRQYSALRQAPAGSLAKEPLIFA
jgi:hypothetical protein